MEPFVAFVLMATVASVVYLLYWTHGQKRAKWWAEAAQAAGLEHVTTSERLGIQWKVAGHVDGLAVVIQSYHRGKEEQGTRVTVSGLRHGLSALSLKAEGVVSAIEKTFGEREIELGDRAFDDAVFLQGDPALVRSIFDADTRRALLALLESMPSERVGGTVKPRRVHVSDNELSFDIRASVFVKTEAALPELLPGVVALAKKLRRPEDPVERLATIAQHDPEEAVRLGALRTLATDHAVHATTLATMRLALADADPAVRLLAATALGAEGHHTLLGLLAGPAPDVIVAKAVSALGTACPPERLAGRLAAAIGSNEAATALACLEVLGQTRWPGAEGAAAAALGAGDQAIAVGAVKALGAIGGETAEAALVGALTRDDDAVRAAAAAALGVIGTTGAVAPLLDAAEASRGATRSAARQAVAEIQSRLSGAAPGQLSLAGAQSGEVSLVEDERARANEAERRDAAERSARARAAQGTRG